jgi:hypothetical protein
MPDISMCQNEDCPSKLKCYRFMARPNAHWQAYSVFVVPKRKVKCDSFIGGVR